MEKEKPSNPSAFPYLRETSYSPSWESESGMTLRDHFAGLAMQGFIGSGSYMAYSKSNISTKENDEQLAIASYRISDAMLKERSKQ